jgi:hypothetical protein
MKKLLVPVALVAGGGIAAAVGEENTVREFHDRAQASSSRSATNAQGLDARRVERERAEGPPGRHRRREGVAIRLDGTRRLVIPIQVGGYNLVRGNTFDAGQNILCGPGAVAVDNAPSTC